MPQNLEVLLQGETTNPRYTRVDFTALRAWFNRLPISQIASLYYDEDSLAEIGCPTPGALQLRLENLRDYLIQRAIDDNPYTADALKRARSDHAWSKTAYSHLVQAADQDLGRPKPQDSISAWLKQPLVAGLKAEGGRTLADLMAMIRTRGAGWYRPIPRIGAGKAAAIVSWLQKHEGALGILHLTPVVLISPGDTILVSPDNPVLVPLEQVRLSSDLNGARGFNRNPTYALVSASNDLEAIDAYLYKFRGKEKTERAYRKELERFLLWCITVRGKAMSSIQQEDCEAYKDFLEDPPSHWIGRRATRLSSDWKPFAGTPAPGSRRYAVQALRTFFEWLVNVRYLAGNPWITVGDPAVATALHSLQIEKALSASLWQKLIGEDGILDALISHSDDELKTRYRMRGAAATVSMSAQFRLVRAALLLMGDTGLRREEAVFATRDKLKPLSGGHGLWELAVLGKRAKWRTVFLPERTIRAIEAHWGDRGQDFSFGLAEIPLLSPIVVPSTDDAQRKHLSSAGLRQDRGFSVDGLYRVVKTAFIRFADDQLLDLSNDERAQLRQAGPHALRHTFGTQAAAGQVPLDVLQRVLGHASLQTTTIYVQAEKQRSIQELGMFFSKTTTKVS